MSVVVWHDVECHGYVADLPLWHELAAAADGPILEVGAGTGRVALDLAAAGFDVTALDIDADLLAELRARAARRGLNVRVLRADASSGVYSSYTEDETPLTAFALVIVPMQTVQLLRDRPGFLAAARRSLRGGGLLAAAIAEDLETFDGDPSMLPEPDVAELDGRRYASHPVAIHVNGATARIDRIHEITDPDGTVHRQPHTTELATLTAAQLESEALNAGFRPLPKRAIPPTNDHVGSTVVLLRA